jgi:NTE family protein
MRRNKFLLPMVFLFAGAVVHAQSSAQVDAQARGAAVSVKPTGKQSGNLSKGPGNAQNGEAGSAPTSGTDGVIRGSSSARTGAETNGDAGGDPSLRPPVTRPQIGLALGGGGAPAMSEIGVLQWFEEHHIPVDRIAGTSMGSMVGGFYATGQSIPELKRVMTADVFQQVFRFGSAYKSLNYRRREDSRELPNAATIGLRHGISLRNSILTDSGLNELLDRQFLAYGDKTNFDSLPIPYRCLTTDLTDSKTVVFSQGSLPDAVRASISIPGLYRPVEINGHRFVDGAVLQNLPVMTVRSMQADVVIAVSLPLSPVSKGELDSLLGVLQRSFGVAIEGNERRSRLQADVLIMPDVSKFGAGDYLKADELAKTGYAAAEEHKAELMKYALNDADWQQYLAVRSSRTRGVPGNVENVVVEAPNANIKHVVEQKFHDVQGAPLNPRRVEALLDDIRSDGRYGADYSVDYVEGDIRRPVLRVMVTDKTTGPPFLLLGANMVAETGPLTRASLEARLLYQDLGGYGSELRGVVQAGSQTEISAEYYRRLTSNGFFLAPKLTFTRMPFNIYSDQLRISERINQNAGGGVDAGWSDGKHMELRAGWMSGYRRWQESIGVDAMPSYGGGWQTARAQFVFDNQDRALIPQFGIRSVTSVGYLYNAVGSENAPQMSTQFGYAHQFAKKNLFDFGVDAGTMLHRNVAQPFLYTLGGPLRLAASAVDEYRGTDYFLVTPAYLRRIAKLPEPLGQSIYVGTAYEAGQMRSPFAPTVTRQDVYVGVVAETPFGVISFGPAIGDAGRRKLVFTLGRFF